METKDVKIGKWYLISSHGFSSNIKGKVIDICGNTAIMKFYWGAPFRTNNGVCIGKLISECKKPGLFSNR